MFSSRLSDDGSITGGGGGTYYNQGLLHHRFERLQEDFRKQEVIVEGRLAEMSALEERTMHMYQHVSNLLSSTNSLGSKLDMLESRWTERMDERIAGLVAQTENRLESRIGEIVTQVQHTLSKEFDSTSTLHNQSRKVLERTRNDLDLIVARVTTLENDSSARQKGMQEAEKENGQRLGKVLDGIVTLEQRCDASFKQIRFDVGQVDGNLESLRKGTSTQFDSVHSTTSKIHSECEKALSGIVALNSETAALKDSGASRAREIADHQREIDALKRTIQTLTETIEDLRQTVIRNKGVCEALGTQVTAKCAEQCHEVTRSVHEIEHSIETVQGQITSQGSMLQGQIDTVQRNALSEIASVAASCRRVEDSVLEKHNTVVGSLGQLRTDVEALGNKHRMTSADHKAAEDALLKTIEGLTHQHQELDVRVTAQGREFGKDNDIRSVHKELVDVRRQVEHIDSTNQTTRMELGRQIQHVETVVEQLSVRTTTALQAKADENKLRDLKEETKNKLAEVRVDAKHWVSKEHELIEQHAEAAKLTTQSIADIDMRLRGAVAQVSELEKKSDNSLGVLKDTMAEVANSIQALFDRTNTNYKETQMLCEKIRKDSEDSSKQIKLESAQRLEDTVRQIRSEYVNRMDSTLATHGRAVVAEVTQHMNTSIHDLHEELSILRTDLERGQQRILDTTHTAIESLTIPTVEATAETALSKVRALEGQLVTYRSDNAGMIGDVERSVRSLEERIIALQSDVHIPNLFHQIKEWVHDLEGRIVPRREIEDGLGGCISAVNGVRQGMHNMEVDVIRRIDLERRARERDIQDCNAQLGKLKSIVNPTKLLK